MYTLKAKVLRHVRHDVVLSFVVFLLTKVFTASNTTQPNPKPFDNPFGSEELMTLPFLDDQLWLDMDWNFDPNFALPITSATVDQTAGTSSRPSDWPSVPPATYG